MRDEDGNDRVADYLRRLDGLQCSIPNVTLKVPTGGGKTLLATAAVERIQMDYFRRQTGFVLWVVPSDAIYKQTWKQLANREHPYRQVLERASGGRVKMLEKGDAFTKQDLACVHGTEGGKFRFTVLETKGGHLKGNDDTAYKQKLFDILTEHAATAMRAGELMLGTESEQLSFTMLMSDSWKQSLEETLRPG